jgi:LCP family protein required for cell wall assembly
MRLYGGSGKKKKSINTAGNFSENDEVKPVVSEDSEDIGENSTKTDSVPETVRTEEEREEIDNLIADYQKYKAKKRIAAAAIIMTVLICSFLLYKSYIRPPKVDSTNSGRNNPGNNPAYSTARPTDVGGIETAEPTAVKAGERIKGMYTLLLVGLDQQYANTDTLMICRFDTVNSKVNIVSIPRDTCANVEYEVKRINAVYAYSGSIDALMNAVSDMTGFKIDNYIFVNIKAFVALISTIGGVYYDVPYNMDWDDPTQDLHIHYNKGYQYLNAYDALNVVRWRQNNDLTVYGDIVRIENQQNFLKAVLKQCLSISNIFTKTDDYVKIFNSYVKTDMDMGNLGWFAQQALKLKEEDIKFATMPSDPSVLVKGFSYGFIYVDEWIEIVNNYINPFDKEITLEDVNLITRDEKGNVYATAGDIAGGYSSFLSASEYSKRLKAVEEKKRAEQAKAETEPPLAAETPTVSDSQDINATSQPETNNVSTEETAVTTEAPAEATDQGLFYTGG